MKPDDTPLMSPKVGHELQITPTYPPRQREKRPPCQGGCPNGGDIRGWVGTVAQRREIGLSPEQAFARAWGMIADVNPFPSVLGRVCPHPCESHCNRGDFDEPVSINAMERFLGDWAIEHSLELPRLAGERQREWIGVVGAGPSGLSFAYQMARRGYRITVYERHEEAGGMLRYGIPDYRLPRDVLDAEIGRIVALGVELVTGVEIGRHITLHELRQRHPVVYFGIGAQKGRGLGLRDEEGPGFRTGVDYLERISRGESIDVGRRVVVVGGGNTAIDAARTARRAEAQVTLLYRRSREEMPASVEEIEEAEQEGVRLELLAVPVRLVRENDRLARVVALRTRLGEPDESGRRRPVSVPGSEFELRADTLIAAVSQQPDFDSMSGFAVDGTWLVADDGGQVIPHLWAGGDVLGLGIAGIAIGQGRRAAENVHARLRGLPEPPDERPGVGSAAIKPETYPSPCRSDQGHLPVERALADAHAEVHEGISEQEFLLEAERCFSCGACMGCGQCAMYCTAGCFTRLEQPEPGMYYTLTTDQCLECGKCIEVCPCGFLEVAAD